MSGKREAATDPKDGSMRMLMAYSDGGNQKETHYIVPVVAGEKDAADGASQTKTYIEGSHRFKVTKIEGHGRVLQGGEDRARLAPAPEGQSVCFDTENVTQNGGLVQGALTSQGMTDFFRK